MTHWFDRKPGDAAMVSKEDPTMLLVQDPMTAPDWVRLPPELGGARHRVKDSFIAPCPQCEEPFDRLHLVLHDTDIQICECKTCGFVCYRLNKASP